MSDDTEKKQHRWNRLQADLGKAAADWEKLNRGPERPSPEEEHLAELRRLLSELEDSLRAFDQ